MLGKLNLEKELREAQELKASDDLLVEAHGILLDAANQESYLRQRLATSSGKTQLDPSGLDSKRIFDADVIKNVAVRYRLRFLDTKYFASEFPREAVERTRDLERSLKHDISDFKILAPAKAFNLCDVNDDPLLFAPLSNGQFYLIHKWGNDLNTFRRVAYWPLRSARHLVGILSVVALVLACLVPTELLTANPRAGFFGIHRILFFVWNILVLSSFTVYAWWAFFGKFSAKAWNDPTFN